MPGASIAACGARAPSPSSATSRAPSRSGNASSPSESERRLPVGGTCEGLSVEAGSPTRIRVGLPGEPAGDC